MFLSKGRSRECTVSDLVPSFSLTEALSQYPVQASFSFPLPIFSSESSRNRSIDVSMSATDSKHIVEGKKRSREEIELIALQQGAKKGG